MDTMFFSIVAAKTEPDAKTKEERNLWDAETQIRIKTRIEKRNGRNVIRYMEGILILNVLKHSKTYIPHKNIRAHIYA